MGFRLFRAAKDRPGEEKASAVGPLMAFRSLGRAVWSPRDHVSLTRNGYEQNVIGFRSVRMVAESAAAIPLVLNENGARMTDHPVLRLLERPNPGQAGRTFMECADATPMNVGASRSCFLSLGSAYISLPTWLQTRSTRSMSAS